MTLHHEPPIVIDTLWAEFWRATEGGELLIQWCAACSRAQFYPRHECLHCGGAVDWRTASGRGRLYSFSEVHWSPLAEFAGDVPYVYALVDLEEGVRVTARIVGDTSGIRCDAPVTVVFAPAGDRTLAQFRLDAPEEESP